MESTQLLQEEKHKYSHYFKDICTYASCIQKRHEFYYQLYTKLNKILKSTMKNAPVYSKFKELNKISPGEITAPGIFGVQSENMKNLILIFDSMIDLSNEYLSVMNVEIFNVFKNMSAYERELIKSERAIVRNAKNQRKTAFLDYLAKQKQLSELYNQIEKENQNLPENPKIKSMLTRYFALLSEAKLSLSNLNLYHFKYIQTTENSTNKIRVSMVEHVTEMKSIFFSTIPFIINYTKRIDSHIDSIEKLKPKLGSVWESDFVKFVMANKFFRTPKPIEIFKSFDFSFDDDMFIPASFPLYCQYDGFPLFYGQSTEKFVSQSPDQLSLEINDIVYLYQKPVYEFVLVSKQNEHKVGFVPTKILKISAEKTLMTFKPQLKTSDNNLSIQTCQLVVPLDDENNKNSKAIMCQTVDGNKTQVDTFCLKLE